MLKTFRLYNVIPTDFYDPTNARDRATNPAMFLFNKNLIHPNNVVADPNIMLPRGRTNLDYNTSNDTFYASGKNYIDVKFTEDDLDNINPILVTLNYIDRRGYVTYHGTIEIPVQDRSIRIEPGQYLLAFDQPNVGLGRRSKRSKISKRSKRSKRSKKRA